MIRLSAPPDNPSQLPGPLGEVHVLKSLLPSRILCSGCPDYLRPTVEIASNPLLLAQEFERVGPLVAQKARYEPEHAERLDGAGGLDLAHVGSLPAELVEDAAYR